MSAPRHSRAEPLVVLAGDLVLVRALVMDVQAGGIAGLVRLSAPMHFNDALGPPQARFHRWCQSMRDIHSVLRRSGS
jgi:hypothetical protein